MLDTTEVLLLQSLVGFIAAGHVGTHPDGRSNTLGNELLGSLKHQAVNGKAVAEELVKNGAEIIFVSTAGDSAEKSVARAMDGGVYFAICGLNTENTHGWGPGRIIAPDGEIIAHTAKSLQPAFSEIDLNKKIRRFWLSLGPAQSHIKGVYKYEKNIEVRQPRS